VPWKPQILFRIWQSSPHMRHRKWGWGISKVTIFRQLDVQNNVGRAQHSCCVISVLVPTFISVTIIKETERFGYTTRDLTQIRSRPLPHSCLPIYYSHSTTPFQAILPELLTESFRVPQTKNQVSCSKIFLRVLLTSKVHHSRNMVFYPEPHESSS
jgi:hypothetical protein